jgi:hypothetical protein
MSKVYEHFSKYFVPYELALKLKELGFYEPCFGYYTLGTELSIDICLNQETFYGQSCSAPIYQQAIDWLRDNYVMYVNSEPTDFKNDPCKTLFAATWCCLGDWNQMSDFEDYNEALHTALEGAINLIQTKAIKPWNTPHTQ